MPRAASQQVPGRGRLSGIERLPPEADGIVAWAADQLAARDRTQAEIYDEFVARCAALQAETGTAFAIPSSSAFYRYSMRLAKLSRRLEETREMVSVLAERFDAKSSDDLTILTAETIKAFVLGALGDADGLVSKDAMHLASALRQAAQAQATSAERRRKAEVDLATRVDDAVEAVAAARGLTAETARAIKAQILGITQESGT